MRRADALRALYPSLEGRAVVTIMGAVAAELQALGHRPNFFYLQHAMGLASSVGLGLALSRPDVDVVVLDGDGSLLMNLGGLTTLARYRPRNLVHVVFDNESLLSVGGFPTATATGSDLAAIAAGAGVPRSCTVHTEPELMDAFRAALDARELTTIVAKVEAVGPSGYVTDLTMLENRFEFARWMKSARGTENRAGEPSAIVTPISTSPGSRPMAILSDLIAALDDGSLSVIDLTQPLGPETPVIGLPPIFASSPGVTLGAISRYDEKGPAWYWNTITMGEHTGTHFDAPVHWVTGKDLPDNACDTIPPRRFIGPACVIDVTTDVERDPDFLLTPERIEAWEREHGRVPKGAWVLLRTGWSGRRDPREFLNVAEDGAHSPGFDPRASRMLATERDVLGVGVETVGTDAGQAGRFDPPFPNHGTMHGAGKFGLASLCNLDRLPPTGAVIIAAPLKIVNGSGSPLRVIAIVPT